MPRAVEGVEEDDALTAVRVVLIGLLIAKRTARQYIG